MGFSQFGFRRSADREEPTSPRKALHALVRKHCTKPEQGTGITASFHKCLNGLKTQKMLDEEQAARERKAQYEHEDQKAKQRAAWKLEDESGSAAKQKSPSNFSYHDEELTDADFRIMRRLKASSTAYEKLPAHLLCILKEAGVGEPTCGRAWRRLSDRSKKTVDNGEGSSRGAAMHGTTEKNGDAAGQCKGTKAPEVPEKKAKTPEKKLPVILILAHPSAKCQDVVRELASELVKEIKLRGTVAVQSTYQYEDLPLLGVPGPPCPPLVRKVNRMGCIELIDIENYHNITITQPSYDKNGKLIYMFIKPLGCSQKDYARRRVVRNHIAADVDGNRLFIITDWLKTNSMPNTVQLYREEIIQKAGRSILPVYVNCAEGSYKNCLFTYKPIGSTKGKDVAPVEKSNTGNGEGPSKWHQAGRWR